MSPNRVRCESSDHRASDDSPEPIDANEPMESTDSADPAEPMDSTDPAEPIDRIEPLEPIDSTESCDQSDHLDPFDAIARVCQVGANRAAGGFGGGATEHPRRMSIDLHTPISAGRSAAEAVHRHAADAVEAARSVDVQAPVDAAAHASRRARRAARRVERHVDHASKRAVQRVHEESARVARATTPSRRGRRALLLVALVGGAVVVAVLAKRMQQVRTAETVPDPFGTAVRAAEVAAPEPDTNSVTTG